MPRHPYMLSISHSILHRLLHTTTLKRTDEDDAIERSQERAYWRKERWSKRVKSSSHDNINPYNIELEPAEEAVPHTIILNDDGENFDTSNGSGNIKGKGKRSFRSFSTMFGGNVTHRHLVATDRTYGFRDANTGASSSITTATTSGAVTKNSGSRSRKRSR